jgi:hypothetical protein
VIAIAERVDLFISEDVPPDKVNHGSYMTGNYILQCLQEGSVLCLMSVKRAPIDDVNHVIFVIPILSTMDIIQQCLSLAPVPCLALAFSAFWFICPYMPQAQVSKKQLEALAQSIARLLQTLDGVYRAGRLLQAQTLAPLTDLCRFVGFVMPCDWICTSIMVQAT